VPEAFKTSNGDITTIDKYATKVHRYFGCDAHLSIEHSWKDPYVPIAIEITWPAKLGERIDEAHLAFSSPVGLASSDNEFDCGILVLIRDNAVVYTLHCPDILHRILGDFPSIHVIEHAVNNSREYDITLHRATYEAIDGNTDWPSTVSVHGRLGEHWPIMEEGSAGLFPKRSQ
jgi:hypothetical protein